MSYERDLPMTLDQIAAELGTTKKNVVMTLRRGLKKISRRPESLRRLRELCELRNKIARREVGL
jgi:transcriptional regulator